jgi:surface polysaccharide O-acyltransferase-like enzyme
MVLMFFIWGETFEILAEKYYWFVYVYGIFKWMAIAIWLLAILGFGKVFLNKPSKVLSYANESVYPLYILHQSVELVFAYYIIQLDLSVLPKFILLVVATFGVSLLIYEILIKRFNLTRLLFGMKPKLITNKFFAAPASLLSQTMLLKEKVNEE